MLNTLTEIKLKDHRIGEDVLCAYQIKRNKQLPSVVKLFYKQLSDSISSFWGRFVNIVTQIGHCYCLLAENVVIWRFFYTTQQ